MQASGLTLEGVVKAIEPRLRLDKFFGTVVGNKKDYEIQAIICFYASHYKAFVYSLEIEAWVLINDKEVSKIGTFGDMRQAMLAGHLLPNVLFYEQV